MLEDPILYTLISQNFVENIISGDSGGGLTTVRDSMVPEQSELIGVVSYSIAVGCRFRGKTVPDVYVDVSRYLDWIQEPR